MIQLLHFPTFQYNKNILTNSEETEERNNHFFAVINPEILSIILYIKK